MTWIGRSTYSGRLAALNTEISKVTAQVAEVQIDAASGLKIHKPSDAGAAVGRLHSLREQLADQDVWQENSGYAMSLLATGEEALNQLVDAFTRARELAVQMASETYDANDRDNAAIEVNNLLEDAVQMGNIEFDGRYLFAGAAYDTEAFDSTGSYIGSASEPYALVSDSIEVATGFVGSDILQGTTDIYAALNTLITELQNNDPAAITTVLGDIDASIDQLSSALTRIGIEWQTAEDAGILADNLSVTLQGALSGVQDADAIETYTRLSELQIAYEAALQVGSTAASANLFSFL
jgi:flagellar hook-associated protein 3 FlgL